MPNEGQLSARIFKENFLRRSTVYTENAHGFASIMTCPPTFRDNRNFFRDYNFFFTYFVGELPGARFANLFLYLPSEIIDL